MSQLEVADVFRQFSPSYLQAFGKGMLTSHKRVIKDIIACRTPILGGKRYQCGDCGETFYAYHGCGNRSCPACHTSQTKQWLEARSVELLPCPYFHVTVTVPSELRSSIRSHQRTCYSLLMKASAQAVLELCADKRYLGGVPALLSVLHTWTASMHYHPHVHLLVSGCGVSKQDGTWSHAKDKFLIPVRALSRLVRGKFMALLKKKHPDLEAAIAKEAWKQDWVTWCKLWGKGEKAVLEYLARYVHRVAITNGRIVSMDEKNVTFRYKDRKAEKMCLCTVSGHEFMRRFLQHVLPKRFHKVRYCGLWHSSKRAKRQELRISMLLRELVQGRLPQAPDSAALTTAGAEQNEFNPPCPHCGSRDTSCIDTFSNAIEASNSS